MEQISVVSISFVFTDTATIDIYTYLHTLSLHDALPILPSRDPEVFQIPLLKSETAIIDRPCLLLANEFGLVKRGKTVYAASLISDEPFFCIAAVWRPAHRLWPESFAAIKIGRASCRERVCQDV